MNPGVRLNRNHELKAGRYGYLAVHNGWPGGRPRSNILPLSHRLTSERARPASTRESSPMGPENNTSLAEQRQAFGVRRAGVGG